MSEIALTEQLDRAIEAVLTGPAGPSPVVDERIAGLVELAADLRHLPRGTFKAQLRSVIEKETSMSTATETKGSAEKSSPSKASPVREGFRTVTPYLTVPDIDAEIKFITEVFGAAANWKGTPTPSALHIYVEDVDEVYQRALAAGATSLMPPTNQEYGDRDAAIEDIGGNHWYIGTHKGASYIPENADDLMAYLHPIGAPAMIKFLKQAFKAEEIGVYQSPEGIVQHAKMRIGNSIIEMGEAHEQWKAMPMTFMLYVADCDAWYERALKSEGAISVSPPSSAPYGGRVGVIKDQFENTWYISTP